MPTTGAIYASNRNHSEYDEVEGDKLTAAFINHMALMTSIEPTHPVYDRIRSKV